jgi:hypothetical protein
MIKLKEFMAKTPAEQVKYLNQLEDQLKNGKHGLYKYGGGCRCDLCKKAKSDSMKKYLKNTKAKKALEKGE